MPTIFDAKVGNKLVLPTPNRSRFRTDKFSPKWENPAKAVSKIPSVLASGILAIAIRVDKTPNPRQEFDKIIKKLPTSDRQDLPQLRWGAIWYNSTVKAIRHPEEYRDFIMAIAHWADRQENPVEALSQLQ